MSPRSATARTAAVSLIGLLLAASALSGCSGQASRPDSPQASELSNSSSTAAGSKVASSDTADALVAVIEAEDSTIYALGVAGAHLPRSEHAAIQRSIERHRIARAHWADALADRGGQVPIPAPAYALPLRVRTAKQAREIRREALTLLASAYDALITGSDAAIAADARAVFARAN